MKGYLKITADVDTKMLSDIRRMWNASIKSVECDCGGKKTYNAKNYSAGHSSWCKVAPGKGTL